MGIFYSNPRKKRIHSEGNIEIMSSKSPFAFTEAYKSLRTNLDFVTLNCKCRKVIVTSAIPGEGKSSVAVNLAITLAENQQRVLLLDSDLRKPAIHRYLHLKQVTDYCLSSLLSGNSKLEASAYHHPDYHMDIILAGTIPPNPAELLGSARMKEVFHFFEEQYDYIICDTPPVSFVTDAAVLSRYCDGVLLVIRQKYATFDQVAVAKKNLESVGANIIGTVLNQYDAEQDGTEKRGYSTHYYQYHYGYYGTSGYSKDTDK